MGLLIYLMESLIIVAWSHVFMRAAKFSDGMVDNHGCIHR
jgi:hypothetical protein